MSTLRQLTSEAELKKIIADQSQQLLDEVKRELGDLEAKYIIARKQRRKALILLIIGFLLPSLSSELLPALSFFSSFISTASTIIGILLVYYAIKYMILSRDVISQFDRTVDRVLFSKVFALLHVLGSTFDQPALLNPSDILTVTDSTSFRSSLRNFLEALKRKKAPSMEEMFAQLATSELIT